MILSAVVLSQYTRVTDDRQHIMALAELCNQLRCETVNTSTPSCGPISFKVTNFGTNRNAVYDFLSLKNINYYPISHRFQVIADYWYAWRLFCPSRSFKVTDIGTNRKLAVDFLSHVIKPLTQPQPIVVPKKYFWTMIPT